MIEFLWGTLVYLCLILMQTLIVGFTVNIGLNHRYSINLVEAMYLAFLFNALYKISGLL